MSWLGFDTVEDRRSLVQYDAPTRRELTSCREYAVHQSSLFRGRLQQVTRGLGYGRGPAWGRTHQVARLVELPARGQHALQLSWLDRGLDMGVGVVAERDTVLQRFASLHKDIAPHLLGPADLDD
jgi:hypothetical protein